jgi:site-specific DNA recombinase
MKEIAKRLNSRGILMRGKPWRVKSVHIILSSLTYSGLHVFNRIDSKTMKVKDEPDWIKTPVPAIVSQDQFDKATKLRGVYVPMRRASRGETSPNLLTGILKCDCGAAMVLQTAKNNQYRYYKCSARISKGDTVCKTACRRGDGLRGISPSCRIPHRNACQLLCLLDWRGALNACQRQGCELKENL